MGKSQNKIVVGVMLLPPDEIMDKAIKINRAFIETFGKEIILSKQNRLPHKEN